jgi:hypothetical protein
MTPDSKKKTTAKNPAKERVAKKTAVKAKKAPAKKVNKKSTITTKPQTASINITSEERWKMIAVAAYHKAEKRGFAPGSELQDWAEAEQEVDELLMSG